MLCSPHLKFLRILSLNLCFVGEVWWDSGACTEAQRVGSCTVPLLLPPCFPGTNLSTCNSLWCPGPYLASPPCSCPATTVILIHGAGLGLEWEGSELGTHPPCWFRRRPGGTWSHPGVEMLWCVQQTIHRVNPSPMALTKSWHKGCSALGCPSWWLGAAGLWEGNIPGTTQVAGWREDAGSWYGPYLLLGRWAVGAPVRWALSLPVSLC